MKQIRQLSLVGVDLESLLLVKLTSVFLEIVLLCGFRTLLTRKSRCSERGCFEKRVAADEAGG